MLWLGVFTIMFLFMSGVVGVGQLYPGLTQFLLDYTAHYTYTEVHIVVRSQDEPELLSAGRRLFLDSGGWTANIVVLGNGSGVLRRFSAFDDASASKAEARPESVRRTDGLEPPAAGGFSKPVFVAGVETALALHRSLNWSVGEEARTATWLLLGESIDPLLAERQLYYPLDNLLTVALWRKKNGRRVEVWEVYQASRLLPHRTSRVGLWIPKAPGDRGQQKGQQQQQEEEEEDGSQQEERTFFPSLNIAPRRKDLTGLHIRCLTESWQPFTDNQPDGRGGVTIGGFMGETFDLLSAFFNFTYDCRRAADRQFGDYVEGNWTGLVGELASGRGDVIVTAMDSTYHRSQVVDFCLPSGDIEYILVIKSPEADPWTNFTRQLQPATWLTCVAFYLLTPLLYFFLVSSSPSLVSLSLQESWFTIQTLLLNQGSLSVEGLPRRAFFLTVVMTSWLIITFYTSVLVSYLTVPQNSLPFTDMSGLLRKGTYGLGLQKGNSEVERLRTSSDPVLQEVWSKIVSRDPGNLVTTADEGFRRVLDENFVYLTERNNYHFLRRGDCSTTTVTKVFTFGAGMVVQKDSPLRLAFSYYTLVQHVTGIMDRSRRRHQPSRPSCGAQEVGALGVTPLVTVFILPAVAAPLAGFLLLVERRFSGRRRASPQDKGDPLPGPHPTPDGGPPEVDEARGPR